MRTFAQAMNAAAHRTPRWHRAVFWCVLGCSVIDRLLVLIQFGFQYTGSDDVIFWNVASDMAKGIFREPFLYGQNYNPALESLLGVPLLWAGVPLHVAMPLITSLLALVPFLSFGLWLLRQGRPSQAALLVAIPVLLPVEWGLMTTITRGFVTGIGVLALLPWVQGIRSGAARDLFTGLLLYAALLTNPNALLFVVPFALVMVLTHASPLRRLVRYALGAAPMLLLHLLALRFYASESDRIVHRMDDWRMGFHPGELIPEGLAQLDRHFAWTSPLLWPTASIALAMLALAVVILAKQKQVRLALSVASAFVIIIVALGFPKIHDGSDHVLFAYSRMFLAMPLLVGWSFILPTWSAREVRAVAIALVVLAPAFMLGKALIQERVVATQLAHQDAAPVREVAYVQFEQLALALGAAAQEAGADLLIGLDLTDSHTHGLLCYGAPATYPTFPPTLYAGPDRRLWRRRAEADAVHATVLVLGGDAHHWESLAARGLMVQALQLNGVTAHVVRNNELGTDALVTLIKSADR